jgi:hypothetical protein
MVTLQQVSQFWRSAATSKLRDVPSLARQHFQQVAWKENAQRAKDDFKKSLDEGGAKPLVQFIGALFVFNYVLSLPKEMAHVAHQDNQRLGIHH